MKHASTTLISLCLIALPHLAFAHPWDIKSATPGFTSGLLHPLGYADHILAMLALGVWLYQQKQVIRGKVLCAILIAMLSGVTLAVYEVEIRDAESVLYFFTLAFGLSLSLKTNQKYLFILSGMFFSLFHGYVHALEIWLEPAVWCYSAGFFLSSCILIVSGMLISNAFNRYLILYNVTERRSAANQANKKQYF